MNIRDQWSRRKFFTTVAGAGAIMVVNPLIAKLVDEIDPRVAKLVANTFSIDTHNHIDVPITAAEVPGPTIDLAGETKKAGLSAICMTFAVDYQPLRNPGDAYERFKNGLASMDQQLTRNGLKRSLNMDDLLTAQKKRQPGIIQSVEGGHFLEGRLERLEEAYNRGLRQLGLLHDNDASVPLGDIYTKPPQWGGLTAFGTDVVKACNRLGILIDLTHTSNETMNAALKVSTKPVVISHTGLDTQLGLNPFMANMMRPRLISKEQAKIVADAGGVIGVWTHLTDSPLAYAQHIRAFVDSIGIDHVCIGTDTKLTPTYRSASRAVAGGPNPQPAGNQQGVGSSSTPQNNTGGGQNRGRVGERTNDAWPDQTTGFYYAVVDALLKTGFSETEIGKIGGGNFCRLFEAATSKHR